MKAFDKGVDAGLSSQILAGVITKEQYERAGKASAQKNFKQTQAQVQFVAGWMSQWKEPHAKDCTCDDCQFYASLIDD